MLLGEGSEQLCQIRLHGPIKKKPVLVWVPQQQTLDKSLREGVYLGGTEVNSGVRMTGEREVKAASKCFKP